MTAYIREDIKQQHGLSVGAGIAIAGAWLAASAFSVFIMLIVFVWGNWSSTSSSEASSAQVGAGIWILIILIAAPLIAAYSISAKIINNKAD